MSALRLAVLTTGRQDWGLLRPLCEALRGDDAFELTLLVGGMACSPAFGSIVDHIREQGFAPAAELAWAVETTQPLEQTAAAVSRVGAALQQVRPDALILLGDRYETAAAALAATVLRVPLVHLYGGEETEGAIDNVLRHAITKLSHLHLVSHPTYADRVIQMGEDPDGVHVVGSLGVDNLMHLPLPARSDLERHLGIALREPLGLVTVHPTTLQPDGSANEVAAVIAAMDAFAATWVVTLPNADAGYEQIRAALAGLADKPNVAVVSALGEERYLGLMKLADFVLGNSSSGMTEAPSLGVPTVNVGDRQRGRLRVPSIIDVPVDTGAIIEALQRATSPQWRTRLAEQPLPFGQGDAAQKILRVLKAWTPPLPPRKRFHTLEQPGAPLSGRR